MQRWGKNIEITGIYNNQKIHIGITDKETTSCCSSTRYDVDYEQEDEKKCVEV